MCYVLIFACSFVGIPNVNFILFGARSRSHKRYLFGSATSKNRYNTELVFKGKGSWKSIAERFFTLPFIIISFELQDIRLKVVILELLAICVETQPGLIEMFLNVQPNKSDKGKKVSMQLKCLILFAKYINGYRIDSELMALENKFSFVKIMYF